MEAKPGETEQSSVESSKAKLANRWVPRSSNVAADVRYYVVSVVSARIQILRISY